MGFKKKNINWADLENFHKQLEIMVKADMPLPDGLRKFADEVIAPDFARSVRVIAEKVEAGSSLSQAMASDGSYFAPEYVAIVGAGERSGNLLAALELAFEHELYEKDFNEKVRSSLTYPAIVFIVIGVVYSVLVTIGFPEFIALYKYYRSEIPWAARAAMTVFNFASAYGIVILLLVLGVVVAARTEAGKSAVDRLILRIPLLKNVLMERFIASLSEGLSILLRANVPLPDSLRLMERITRNGVLRKAIGHAASSAAQGAKLGDSLKQSGTFPDLFISSIGIGEDGNLLPDSLKGISGYYKSETLTHAQVFLKTLDAVSLCVLGIWTGFLLAALYSMYWKLSLVVDHTKIW